jgi:hypothetical protein
MSTEPISLVLSGVHKPVEGVLHFQREGILRLKDPRTISMVLEVDEVLHTPSQQLDTKHSA